MDGYIDGCQKDHTLLHYSEHYTTLNFHIAVLGITGGDYTEMGLAATTVASSFGKVNLQLSSSFLVHRCIIITEYVCRVRLVYFL